MFPQYIQPNNPKEEDLTTGVCNTISLSMVFNLHFRPHLLVRIMKGLGVDYVQFCSFCGSPRKETQI